MDWHEIESDLLGAVRVSNACAVSEDTGASVTIESMLVTAEMVEEEEEASRGSERAVGVATANVDSNPESSNSVSLSQNRTVSVSQSMRRASVSCGDGMNAATEQATLGPSQQALVSSDPLDRRPTIDESVCHSA